MTRLRSTSFGAARLVQSQVRRGIRLACRAVAKRSRALATAAFILLGGSTRLLACPVCFGAEETPLIDGARLGILVMLGITFAVQGGFVGFFLYLRRRAKRIAEVELDAEWSELQRGSRTT